MIYIVAYMYIIQRHIHVAQTLLLAKPSLMLVNLVSGLSRQSRYRCLVYR